MVCITLEDKEEDDNELSNSDEDANYEFELKMEEGCEEQKILSSYSVRNLYGTPFVVM